MNIPTNKAETFLSRTDLCSMKEAVDYAKKSDKNYDIWKVVFERSDFQEYILKTLSPTDAFIYVKELDEFYIWNDIWKAILERSDVQNYLLITLSLLEAVDYAKTCGDWQIWEIVINRNDLQEYLLKTISPVEAIAYSKNINNFRIWEIVFRRTDITPKEVIACAKEIKYEYEIWETIFNRSDIKEYILETLSPIEVIAYAKEINYWRIWGFIFEKRANLPIKETVLAYSKRGKQKGYGSDFDHWHVLAYGVNQMAKYLLETLSSTEALNFAKEINCWNIWKIVLYRNDISLEEAITCAKDIKHKEVWKTVLGRKDISNAEAITYAKEIDDPQVWEMVLEKK